MYLCEQNMNLSNKWLLWQLKFWELSGRGKNKQMEMAGSLSTEYHRSISAIRSSSNHPFSTTSISYHINDIIIGLMFSAEMTQCQNFVKGSRWHVYTRTPILVVVITFTIMLLLAVQNTIFWDSNDKMIILVCVYTLLLAIIIFTLVILGWAHSCFSIFLLFTTNIFPETLVIMWC